MSLTKYRISTRLDDEGTSTRYQVEKKGWFGWRNAGRWKYDYCGDRYRELFVFSNLEDAKTKLHKLVDEEAAALVAKEAHKKFKPQVVYGPYPP